MYALPLYVYFDPYIVLNGQRMARMFCWCRSYKRKKLMIQSIKSLSDEFFPTQVINEPTHKEGNILDLVLCNNQRLIDSYSCTSTLSISHHHIIQVATLYKPNIQVEINNNKRTFHTVFEKLNFAVLCRSLPQ